MSFAKEFRINSSPLCCMLSLPQCLSGCLSADAVVVWWWFWGTSGGFFLWNAGCYWQCLCSACTCLFLSSTKQINEFLSKCLLCVLSAPQLRLPVRLSVWPFVLYSIQNRNKLISSLNWFQLNRISQINFPIYSSSIYLLIRYLRTISSESCSSVNATRHSLHEPTNNYLVWGNRTNYSRLGALFAYKWMNECVCAWDTERARVRETICMCVFMKWVEWTMGRVLTWRMRNAQWEIVTTRNPIHRK